MWAISRTIFNTLRSVFYLYICLEMPSASWFGVHYVLINYLDYIDPYQGSSLVITLISSVFMGLTTFSAWLIITRGIKTRYYLLLLGICFELSYLCIAKYMEIGFLFLQADFLASHILPCCIVVLFGVLVNHRINQSIGSNQ